MADDVENDPGADPKGEDPASEVPPAVRGLLTVGERCVAAIRLAAAAIASRRGMGLTVAGGFVVALAWVGERDSAWGFPMLLAGALMIGLGLLGPRLSGSMAVRWDDDGAFFQLTSTIAPPGKRHRAPELIDPEPEEPARELPEKLIPPSEIEGEAETIDFRVEAAETAGSAGAH